MKQKGQFKLKNLTRKSTDCFIALLNCRTTPLQIGGRIDDEPKTQKFLPTVPSQHVPFKPEVEKFKVKDEHFSNQQKHYHDLHHRAKTTTTITTTTTNTKKPLLSKGQPVWMKTPATKEAVMVKTLHLGLL